MRDAPNLSLRVIGLSVTLRVGIDREGAAAIASAARKSLMIGLGLETTCAFDHERGARSARGRTVKIVRTRDDASGPRVRGSRGGRGLFSFPSYV